MSTVADKTARPGLTPAQRALLDRILRLRPAQQRRISQLVKLYQETEDPEEAIEIGEVLAEILFRSPEDLKGTPVSKEQSRDAGKALRKHRTYVGNQIRKHRQRLNMSQDELARKAGIPQSHVCRLETGKHAPTYVTIKKLAQALGVQPSDLDLGFDDEE